ncbi:outer membrane beta-barrel protein [Chitinophaga sp.]|uniref:outer membrane beta-barrel protein n=1 Tax=Chitinophaga sp. TaxID=1869181 RepID=UPI0031DCEC0F
MIRILFSIALVIMPLIVSGQNKFYVRGQVKDTSGQQLIGANVWLFTAKDTFHTITDDNGSFGFKQIPGAAFSIKITILGYEIFNNTYSLNSDNYNIILPIIFLNTKPNILREVIVKSRFSPITLKEDTIEYSISQYHLRENAQINDLLKRLPGIEVDRDGNIKFMGRPISKIKVNGKEFVVGNIQDLLKLIPLETLEKVQVIDDYDKMAELTGRPTETNAKVLNLQTRHHLNTTNNLKTEVGAGTNKRYAADVLGSAFDNKKQIIINGRATNSIPGPGETSYKKGILLYRNQLTQSLYTNGGIFAEHGSHNEQVYSNITNQTADGNIRQNNTTHQASTFDNYNFAETIDLKDQKQNTVSMQVIGERKLQTDNSSILSSQSGLQHLDQSIENITNKVLPNIRGSIYGAHHFRRAGELLALGFNFNYAGNKSDQYIHNNTIYYNNDGTIALDSLLHQLISKTNNLQTISLQTSYIKPFNANSSMELNYTLRSNKNIFKQQTQWANKEGKMNIIDSLSNQFNYLKVEQKIGINYKKTSLKIDYTFGVNLFYASYGTNRSKWLLPSSNVSYKIDKTSRLAFRYEGRPIYPDYNQLRPIPDRSNPLFPIVGNPNLKASISNLFTLDYNKVSKSILFISLSVSPILNQVVSNTILIQDTLNTVIQETHYRNSNGAYTLSGNYSWSHPFSEGKYQLFLDGSSYFNNNIFYLQNIRNTSQNLTVSQSLRTGIYQKWIELNTGIGFTFNHTNYSSPLTPSSNIRSWNMNLNTKFFVGKSWSLWLDIVKQINTGYANGVTANPTDLGATIEKTLLKNMLICRLQGFNLLDQNSGVAQTISANTTTQTRTNQLGRYILFSLLLDLKKTKK